MYRFTEDCMIGIQEIDEEHRHLFQLLNDATEIMNGGGDTRVVGKNLLQKL